MYTNPLQGLEDKASFPYQIGNPDFFKAYKKFHEERQEFYFLNASRDIEKFHPSFKEKESFFLIHIPPQLGNTIDLRGDSAFAIVFVQYLYTDSQGFIVARHHQFEGFFLRRPIPDYTERPLPLRSFADSVKDYGEIKTYNLGDGLFNPHVVFRLQPEDYHYFKDFFIDFPQFQQHFKPFTSTSPPTHFL